MTKDEYNVFIAGLMPERTLEVRVRETCRAMGLLAYHTHDSRRSEKGFPDWVICGPRRTIFRELKRESGKPTREQEEWLHRLVVSGQDAAVWKPSDWISDRIVTELRTLI